MAIKQILKKQYQLMPWKNGHGTTAQIQIYPKSAAFPGDDFLWRLSSATVKASGPFSVFPGCDRLLTVLSGEGLQLNDSKLVPLSPLHFSGEFQIQGQLLGGEVVDLGLIYRRNKVRAEMALVGSIKLDKAVRTHLVFCVSGAASINGHKIEAGDTLQIEGEKEIALQEAPSESAKFIHIKLYY